MLITQQHARVWLTVICMYHITDPSLIGDGNWRYGTGWALHAILLLENMNMQSHFLPFAESVTQGTNQAIISHDIDFDLPGYICLSAIRDNQFLLATRRYTLYHVNFKSILSLIMAIVLEISVTSWFPSQRGRDVEMTGILWSPLFSMYPLRRCMSENYLANLGTILAHHWPSVMASIFTSYNLGVSYR